MSPALNEEESGEKNEGESRDPTAGNFIGRSGPVYVEFVVSGMNGYRHQAIISMGKGRDLRIGAKGDDR